MTIQASVVSVSNVKLYFEGSSVCYLSITEFLLRWNGTSRLFFYYFDGLVRGIPDDNCGTFWEVTGTFEILGERCAAGITFGEGLEAPFAGPQPIYNLELNSIIG